MCVRLLFFVVVVCYFSRLICCDERGADSLKHTSVCHMMTNKSEVNLVKFFRRFFWCCLYMYIVLCLFLLLLLLFLISFRFFLLRIYDALSERQIHRNTKFIDFMCPILGIFFFIKLGGMRVACTRGIRKQNKIKSDKTYNKSSSLVVTVYV